MAPPFDPASIARILVRAPNWLGDAVMALPAMGAVRRAFPRSTIAVAAPASVAPLFQEITPLAPDEILSLDRKTEIAELRRARFDLAVLFPNSFRSAWVVRRAGIPHRWGLAAGGRGWLLTQGVRTKQKGRHQADRYADLMEALGIGGVDDAPHVAVTPVTRQRTADVLARSGVAAATALVGFAPGAAYGHAKRWPPRRVADLVARLTERGAVCVLVGAAADRDAGREIESVVPASTSVVNLIGRTDLRVLAGVLERCQAFASNDSGAMHLAAALGVPVTAIFGPTDERITAPRGHHEVQVISQPVFCRPCMLRDCPIDHRCMKRITVDRVFESIVPHLRLPAESPR